jgi:group I intron endonuclease
VVLLQYVYKIINKINNKFYIGRTQNLKERWNQHIERLRNNKHHCIHLQRAWNKCGEENFEFKLLKVFNTGNPEDDRYLAIKLEQHFLDNFKLGTEIYNTSHNALSGALKGENHPNYKKHPKDWMSEEGYKRTMEFHKNKNVEGKNNPFYRKNHSEETKKILREKCPNYGEKNGFYGKTHTEETRKKLSEMAKQRTGEKNPFYGKKHTKETKEKISNKLKGRMKGIPLSEEQKQKMRKNSPNNTKVMINGVVYISFSDAARKLGINRKIIAKRARSDDPKYSNYIII